MKVVNKRIRKIPKGYSDTQWQQDFLYIKEIIQPSSLSKMKIIPESYHLNGEYHGKTQYQYYCDGINDILSTIRRGEIDYCYHIYQIEDLLKYEHDRLKAEWLPEDGCFKLSLNK